MKKTVLKSSLLAGLLTLFLCFSCGTKQSLKDIEKPYLGEYQCTRISIGETPYLQRFDFIVLELKTNEKCVLQYQEKNGKKQRLEGGYVYDGVTHSVMFTFLERGAYKRKFPLKDGKLQISFPLNNTLFIAEFIQK